MNMEDSYNLHIQIHLQKMSTFNVNFQRKTMVTSAINNVKHNQLLIVQFNENLYKTQTIQLTYNYEMSGNLTCAFDEACLF